MQLNLSFLSIRPTQDAAADFPAVKILRHPLKKTFPLASPLPSRKEDILEESRMVIDVSCRRFSVNPKAQGTEDERKSARPSSASVYGDRRLAALIDFCCLLFAYGGFLALFGSLGGNLR